MATPTLAGPLTPWRTRFRCSRRTGRPLREIESVESTQDEGGQRNVCPSCRVAYRCAVCRTRPTRGVPRASRRSTS
ncbi:uncharacterized protein SOCE836_090170 [Sorangium cellulosum]|uniref:Uncharacterized protein n=1 Tax=Sorangium cellulosum TaxID=56 RepID=A0A4P2R1J8_SORCE|nr:uncharacterized protein SOCE836_090170 [Sorangium cellulosum]